MSNVAYIREFGTEQHEYTDPSQLKTFYDAKNKIGPQLNGIIDAEIASVEGFKYSKAFLEKKTEGLVWNEEALEAYLTKPKDFIAGTKMTFAGLRKEQDRADVIAYLRSFE